MTNDPFAAAADGMNDDLFSDPSRSSYPKVGELLHKLLIMIPVEMEQVENRNNPGKMQDRWKIDTTVISEDGTAETYDEMFWSHKSIAAAAKKAKKGGRPLLGTLHLFPVMGSLKRFPDEAALLADEDIRRWLSRGEGMPPTQVAWALEAATDDQKKLAIAWWNKNRSPFSA